MRTHQGMCTYRAREVSIGRGGALVDPGAALLELGDALVELEPGGALLESGDAVTSEFRTDRGPPLVRGPSTSRATRAGPYRGG